MIAPNPFFQIDIAEKFTRPGITATHLSTPNLIAGRMKVINPFV